MPNQPTPVFTRTRELLSLIRRLANSTTLIYEDQDGGGRPVDMVRIPFDTAGAIVLGEIFQLVQAEARQGNVGWNHEAREWVPMPRESLVARVRGGR